MNATGAELAPNFAEIAVMEDRVRVTLEIDPADLAVFAPGTPQAEPPDLSALGLRPGTAFGVTDQTGAELAPSLVSLDLAPRTPKPSAPRPAAMPPPPVSEVPSATVARAVLEFPFSGRPARLTFAPPLDAEGRPLASVGFLAQHGRAAVTDYRYLSQPETLRLDWDDPWFSAFENPNLARHHRSPLMSFITIAPREVRHEIIFRLRDLEGWAALDLGDADALDAARIAEVKAAAARFFSARNPITIDDAAVAPVAARVEALDLGVAGLRVAEAPDALDRGTALFGVILSYPRAGLPNRLDVTWELYPDGVDAVPVSVADPAGPMPGQATRGDPKVRWTNYLRTWSDPVVAPIAAPAGPSVRVPLASAAVLGLGSFAAFRAFRSTRRRRWLGAAAVACLFAVAALHIGAVAVPLPAGPPGAADASALARAALANATIALLEPQEAAFDAALQPFVPAAERDAVAAEIRRGLAVTLPSGARGQIEALSAIEIEQMIELEDGFGALARWRARVSGGHWGHAHRRDVEYRALLDMRRHGSVWMLTGLTVLSARQT